MRSAVIGISTILIIMFTFAAMSTIARDSLMYQEASNACNEGIYAAFVMLTEDDGSIQSDEDLKEAFTYFANEILRDPESYRIRIYGADCEKGILSAGISYSWIPWISRDLEDGTKTIECRRTMIIDEID